MAVSFNSNGNLHNDVELSFDEFEQLFGTNEMRSEKIKTAFKFFKLFRSCGCTTVYIGGSFVSKKVNPEDIDLCFDLRNVDYAELKNVFPDFFDYNKIGAIHSQLKCHILYFDSLKTRFLNMLQEDRDGYPKGLVKINLNKISYD